MYKNYVKTTLILKYISIIALETVTHLEFRSVLTQHIFGCWSNISAAHSIIKCWHGVNSLIRGTIDLIECWYKYILHFMLVHKLWSPCTILLANSHFCQPFYFKLPYEFQPAPCRQTPKIFKSIKFHVVFILTTSRSHILHNTYLNIFIRLHWSPDVMERHLTKFFFDVSSFLVCDELRKKLHSFKLKFPSDLVSLASLKPQLGSQTNTWNCNYTKATKKS